MAEQVQIDSTMYFTPGFLSANPQVLLEIDDEEETETNMPRSSNG